MPRRAPAPRHRARREAARSLADDLRGRLDDELARLLVDRPDLARPAPPDLTALAARASTRASVQRAVERLDRGLWYAAQAAVVAAQAGSTDPTQGLAGPVEPAAVAGLLGARGPRVRPLLERLWELALLWRSERGLELTRALPEALGPHPAGLGVRAADINPRYAAHTPPLGADLDALLQHAPAEALAVLDRLTWAGPTGHLPGSGPARLGAQWLVDHGLAAPSGVGHVTLVREVALARRGGWLHREVTLDPPEPALTTVDPAAVERAAGAAAREVLDRVDELAGLLSSLTPRVLRAGGMSARDVARLATALGSSPEHTAWLLETSAAAGLLADDGEFVPVWAPTGRFDEWQAEAAGTRWAYLTTAWLSNPRVAPPPAEPGSTTPAVTALGPDGQSPGIRGARADVLAQLAEVPAGQAIGERDLVELLAWHRPLRDAQLTTSWAAAVRREAHWLGLAGLGALSRPGRALAAGASLTQLTQAAADALPGPVDHIMLQADLTAIAPGPLEGELARLMRLVADVESRGGAIVLRFTADTVRRAFDAGWGAEDLLSRLAAASSTPVPQPLDYLVRDLARRHGQTRVGGATAYLRSDDAATLAAMLADRALAPAMLRQIAPTVLIARAEPATLIGLLRDSGYAPVHEAFDGSLVIAEPVTRRARLGQRRGTALAPPEAGLDRTHAAAVVTALRAAPPRPVPGQAPARVLDGDPADTAAQLRQAVSDALAVWLGYADGNGRTTRHLVRPVRVDGGRVYAVSADSDSEQLFLLHRITGVVPA